MPTARPRKRAAGSALAVAAATFGLAALACEGKPREAPAVVTEPPPGSDDHAAELAGLVRHEQAKRAALDHVAAPPWSERSGPDPSALLEEGSGTALGLLRSGAIVRLSAQAEVLARAPTLRGATGLTRVGEDVLVVAEGDGRIDVLDAAHLRSRLRPGVPGVASIRDVAFGPERRVYLTDPHRHRVLQVPWPPGAAAERTAEPTEVAACAGALDVERVGEWLVYSCLLDHTVVAHRIAEDGTVGAAATLRHDGPIWSFDAVVSEGGGLRLVLGGVEDHPLQREDGAFGYVDSFAFTAEVDPTVNGQAPAVRRTGAINLSELGIVTPKHVAWQGAGTHALVARVTGYGGDRAAILRWPQGLSGAAVIDTSTVVPGIVDMVGELGRGLAADPLLDAWLVLDGGTVHVVSASADGMENRTASERLGEALAFTTLMAPHGSSEGKKSRFTCETCHFEGRGDGRVHFTGRGQVHATTKTLRGLFPNRPHFSRALDRTTAKMVHNEFSVASRGTGHDPWFSLRPGEDAPWLRHLGIDDASLDPVALRRALVDFIATFTPEPNPAVRGRLAFDEIEHEGARLFALHCESCHAARLVADDPASRVDPERWEEAILSASGPIVWGREGRERAGVEPYVHPDGARVPSLRRLWVKRPYLTNGRAATLDDVLDAVRLEGGLAHGGGDGRAASLAERRALRAFLDLL